MLTLCVDSVFWFAVSLAQKLRMLSLCVDSGFGFAVSLAPSCECCHHTLTVISGLRFLMPEVENVVIVR